MTLLSSPGGAEAMKSESAVFLEDIVRIVLLQAAVNVSLHPSTVAELFREEVGYEFRLSRDWRSGAKEDSPHDGCQRTP